jgi:hypothetical protein
MKKLCMATGLLPVVGTGAGACKQTKRPAKTIAL